MNHTPSRVRYFIARQLGIHDITVLAEYGQRENTRREHAALIRQHYDYREFAWPWTFRLTRLLYTRSWISNERPALLFDLATGWLMPHRIILPGATTLTRLISEVREKATLRLWNRLAMIRTVFKEDNTNVNETQVSNGMAWAYRYHEQVRIQPC